MNTLSDIWLALTGGEMHCRRGRFALTMLIAYGLHHLLLPGVVACGVTLKLHGLPGDVAALSYAGLFAGLLASAISMLMAFLPFSPLALLGTERQLMEAYRVAVGSAASATEAPPALWPYWLGFLAGSLVLLLVGGVAFGAAWRRLKDAGRSPLFLLLGLTYLLGFNADGSYSAEAAGLYLLGPLWLIILYSQPSKRKDDFPLFREVK